MRFPRYMYVLLAFGLTIYVFNPMWCVKRPIAGLPDHGTSSIPRILHQLGPATLTPHQQACQASAQKHNPGWTYTYWTDAEADAIVQQRCPYVGAAYKTFSLIQKTDVARYCILLHHGGVYADLDTEWYGPAEDLLQGSLSLAYSLPILPCGLPLMTNYVMASVRGHPMWRQLMSEIQKRHEMRGWPWWAVNPSLRVPFLTGSRVLSYVAQIYHVNVLQEPAVTDLFCHYTPVPAAAVVVHRGGTARYHDRGWSVFKRLVHSECQMRQILGLRGNIAQLPFVTIACVGAALTAIVQQWWVHTRPAKARVPHS